MELRRLLKKIRCGWMDSDYENVLLARIPRYFLLLLALFAVVVTIPTTSALPPAPYLPTGPDHGQHIDASYFPNGQIYSYLVGNDVTNGGGAGNVFYTIYGDHLSLKSKIFWMESGETVTVWAELCDGICSIIPAQMLYWNVRASQAGDTDVGSLIITPFTPRNHGFSGTPKSGPAPLTVNFTDTSAGSWTVWEWDFGDGGTSTLQNPSHTYLRSGTYNVSLFVQIPRNSSTSYRQDNYITVTSVTNAMAETGVYRPSAHTFYLKNGTAVSWTTTAINWGTSTDLPVTGDWNGDGRTDVGVYRPSAHTFYLKNGTTTAINWGASTDLPVTGDWNGDGRTDVGVYRPSAHTFYLKNGTTTAINWGISTDLPVTGDWNGDGITDIGVYRPSTHMFYLKNGTALSWTTTAINWGVSSDLPVTGKW